MDSDEFSLAEADSLLEEGLYSRAREAYRAIAMAERPVDVLLWNLAIAEVGDIIDFRRSLIIKFPNSCLSSILFKMVSLILKHIISLQNK